MSQTKTHEYKVTMTCEGCSGAVERVLNKIKGKGVEGFDINLEKQSVHVKTTMSADEILEVIKKTGKETQFIGTN